MSHHHESTAPASVDRVSDVLKWILLAVAVICFALFFWATAVTYERAPPQPEQFVAPDGATVMSASDIVAGKAGFQKADLMDYGSLYGMGSYFGQDYTAFALVRVATLTEENLAQTRFGKAFGTLSGEQQAVVRRRAAGSPRHRSDQGQSHVAAGIGRRNWQVAFGHDREPRKN